jgi:hypothetical protein
MEMPRYIQPVTCADGTRISIQANNDRTRCAPESNFGPWTAFDVLVESPERLPALDRYKTWDEAAEVVYSYLPVEQVRALIEAHGGTSDDWEGFEPPSVEWILRHDYNDVRDAVERLGVEVTLVGLAAIIADGTASLETRGCAAERARWVAGFLF